MHLYRAYLHHKNTILWSLQLHLDYTLIPIISMHSLNFTCHAHKKNATLSCQISISFQIAYNLEFLILHIRPWRVPWLHGCGKSAIYPWDHNRIILVITGIHAGLEHVIFRFWDTIHQCSQMNNADIEDSEAEQSCWTVVAIDIQKALY